jgi:hypothetical protein
VDGTKVMTSGKLEGRSRKRRGPRFDPASAPLGAGASRRIERGRRCAPTVFRHDRKVVPCYKSGWLGFHAFHICQKRTDVEHPRAVWISKRGKLLRFKRLALVTGDGI